MSLSEGRPRIDRMRPAGKRAEHPPRVVFVFRLAEQFTVKRHNRIGAENQAVRVLAQRGRRFMSASLDDCAR